MPVSIRYIVHDVDQAVVFYTTVLGFTLDFRPSPSFARLIRGELHLLINQPGAGGAGQSMPDGNAPSPGGWNRIQLTVENLDDMVKTLRAAGHRFRSDIIQGNGGKQILIDDPSGNPIELFEPPARR
jgi:catechol 2,3-dioxygenase-like lactoylglutathione lyase family enzyme